MSQQSNRSFNPYRVDVADGTGSTPHLTFHTGMPLPDSPVVFTSHLESPVQFDEFLTRLGGTERITTRGVLPAHTTTTPNRAVFGEGLSVLGSGVDGLSDTPEFSLIATIRNGDLLLITGEVSGDCLIEAKARFVSDGYPDRKEVYGEIAREVSLSNPTQTSTPKIPAVTIDFPVDATRTDMRLDEGDIVHHVVDKKSELVVGLIINNPFNRLNIEAALSEDSASLSNANLYALHENKFSEGIDEMLAMYPEIYCPLETPHPINEGTEYGMSSATIVELTPVHNRTSHWNVHLTCNPLTTSPTVTERLAGKFSSVFGSWSF